MFSAGDKSGSLAVEYNVQFAMLFFSRVIITFGACALISFT